MKIKLLVDSTCDLPIEYLHENDITVIPLLVNFNEEEYQDLIELQAEGLYELVDKKGMLPKTAARSVGVFLETFKKYLNEGYDQVIFMGISSKFSSTIDNARMAAKEFPGKVYVHDTYNLSTGEGIQVVKAIKLLKEGKTCEEILWQLKELAPKIRSQFTVENLEYLYKGGRCSQTSYYLGQGFKIKPIIRVVDGGMIVYKKVVGKINNAINKMISMLKDDLDNLDLDVVMITHSLADDAVKYAYDKLKEFIPEDKIMITRAGCVISSHCGRGTIGILYALKENK